MFAIWDIFKLGLPLMAAQVFILAMLFTDSVMVGHVSKEALGAVSLGVSYYNIFFVSGIGVIVALSPMVTHRYGADDYSSIGKVIHQGFYVIGILSVAILLGISLSRFFLTCFGQSPDLIEMTVSYLWMLVFGAPAVLGYICLRQWTEGIGDTIPSVVFALIAALGNVALDYVLVFGKLGLPSLGATGAGIATSMVNWILLGMALFYVRYHPRYQKFGFWQSPGAPDPKLIREILYIGLPYAGSLILEIAYFSAATFFIGTIGKTELAGHQVALNAASMTFMVPLGLSFAVSIRVGQAVGKEHPQGVWLARRAAFYSAIGIQTFLGLGFIIFAPQVARIYTPDPDVIEWAVRFLRIAGIFQIFDGLQVIGMGALRGLKDTFVPFIFNLIAYWVVGAGSSYFLYRFLGAEGVWYGMVFGLGFAAVAHHWRFIRLARH